jgi:hypothetical protein
MKVVRSFCVKHSIALWAFQLEFVFLSQEISTVLNIITSARIHLCLSYGIAYQITIKSDLQKQVLFQKRELVVGDIFTEGWVQIPASPP